MWCEFVRVCPSPPVAVLCIVTNISPQGRVSYNLTAPLSCSYMTVPRDSCQNGAAIAAPPLESEEVGRRTKGPPIPVSRTIKYVHMLGDVDKKGYHSRAWYVQHTMFPFFAWWLSVLQHKLGVRGSVGEIGVHHGGFFLAMAVATSHDEPLFVIDLFDKLQKLNVDGSGKGAWYNFSSNTELLDFKATIVADPASFKALPAKRGVRTVEAVADASTNVDGPQFRALARTPVRMFSVDGGHTREATCHDLNLADSYLHDGGIIMVDDVGCCNRESSWGLGVIDGIFSFYDGRSSRRLVPFFYASPKLFLARPKFARKYERALREAPELQRVFRFDDGWRELGGPRGKTHPKLHPTRYTLLSGKVSMPGRQPKESEVTELWSELLQNHSRSASARQQLATLMHEQQQRKPGFLARLFHMA